MHRDHHWPVWHPFPQELAAGPAAGKRRSSRLSALIPTPTCRLPGFVSVTGHVLPPAGCVSPVSTKDKLGAPKSVNLKTARVCGSCWHRWRSALASFSSSHLGPHFWSHSYSSGHTGPHFRSKATRGPGRLLRCQHHNTLQPVGRGREAEGRSQEDPAAFSFKHCYAVHTPQNSPM